MSSPIFVLRLVINGSSYAGPGLYDIDATVSNTLSTYTVDNVAEGNVVYLDFSQVPGSEGTYNRYVVSFVSYASGDHLIAQIQYDDTPGTGSTDPLDVIGYPGFIGSASTFLSLTALGYPDALTLPRDLITAAITKELYNRVDRLGNNPQGATGIQGVTGPSGGGSGGGGATGVQGATGLPGTSGGKWTSGKAYAAGAIVFSDGLAFSALSSHTSSANFTLDLDKWESMDNRAWVGLQASHGFTGLQPAYQNSSGTFLKARADAAETLATHLVLHSSANYLLAVSGGDFTYAAHGLTGVECCSPTVAGAMTPVQPDPTIYYINPVVAVSTVDQFRVVSEQPAYYRW